MVAVLTVGLLVFPKVQQLDLTGPYEVFASIPGVRVLLLWKDLDPIVSATGLVLVPDTRLAEAPQVDVLCVPGGAGVNALMEDEEVLGFLRRQSEGARFVQLGLLRGAGPRRRRAAQRQAGHHPLGQP